MLPRLSKLCTIIAFLAAAVAVAASAPPPSVARPSYLRGDVSYHRGDQPGSRWADLALNTPLLTGDALYASQGGRAEVELGLGNVAQIAGQSELDLVDLSDTVTQLGVPAGEVDFRVRGLPPGHDVEVDTPTASATVRAAGSYRISAAALGASFDVISGRLDVAVDGRQVEVSPGESLHVGTGASPSWSVGPLGPPSPFDRWAGLRDARYDESRSSRYVNPLVMGVSSLDGAGVWHRVPTYGYVWTPGDVRPGWAPYQDGDWIWEDPFGWTWVSFEPWGWAPFHYGRWVYDDDDWCWVPPPPAWYDAPPVCADISPFYAPALVGFIGGDDWSLGLSFGGPCIGWFPLGPGDPYYYPWEPEPVGLDVDYVNVHVVNAVTVIPRDRFGRGRFHRLRVPRGRLARPPVMGLRPRGILPTREGLTPYPHRVLPLRAVPPARFRDRSLVARLRPPLRPVSFRSELAAMKRTGRPYVPGRTHLEALRAGEGVRGGRRFDVRVRPALSRFRPAGRGPAAGLSGGRFPSSRRVRRGVRSARGERSARVNRWPKPRAERPAPNLRPWWGTRGARLHEPSPRRFDSRRQPIVRRRAYRPVTRPRLRVGRTVAAVRPPFGRPRYFAHRAVRVHASPRPVFHRAQLFRSDQAYHVRAFRGQSFHAAHRFGGRRRR